jgi:pimeloyl-ACP methyl ester carboxylesterase
VFLIQVILVGHSCGGASVSYALEHYPKKISKAVFVTATMVKGGQRPFDVFSEEVRMNSLFIYMFAWGCAYVTGTHTNLYFTASFSRCFPARVAVFNLWKWKGQASYWTDV